MNRSRSENQYKFPGKVSVQLSTAIVQLECGATHTILLTNDKESDKIYGWGGNEYGQLGENNKVVRTPGKIGNSLLSTVYLFLICLFRFRQKRQLA